MNLNLNLQELSSVINGKIIKGNENIKINSLCFDTRKIQKGDIFFALKGKKFDANEYIKEAVEKGARGIICQSKKFPYNLLNYIDFCIETKDTLKALHKIAAYHRSKYDIPVISVTGSNGKTTTKEMIKTVLSIAGRVCSNIGNFNNEYGLPFSVLEMDNSHKYSVFEIGSSQRGDVAKLAKIIKPDIAVITTIAPEHLEFFKNMENIYKTETEVISYLKDKNSSVIFNGDNSYLKRLLKLKIKKYTFGYETHNDLIIKKHNKNFYFLFENKEYKINLSIDGDFNYLNAAAAFLTAKLCNLKDNKIIEALENFSGVKMRMQKIKAEKNTIFFDAYNANPQSMKTALDEIKKYKKYILILGDMKELGKYSKYYHKELAKFISETNPLKIFLIGKEIETTYKYLSKDLSKKEKVKYYTNTESAKKDIINEMKKQKQAIFLFKASRSMKFEELLEEKYSRKVK